MRIPSLRYWRGRLAWLLAAAAVTIKVIIVADLTSSTGIIIGGQPDAKQPPVAKPGRPRCNPHRVSPCLTSRQLVALFDFARVSGTGQGSNGEPCAAWTGRGRGWAITVCFYQPQPDAPSSGPSS